MRTKLIRMHSHGQLFGKCWCQGSFGSHHFESHLRRHWTSDLGRRVHSAFHVFIVVGDGVGEVAGLDPVLQPAAEHQMPHHPGGGSSASECAERHAHHQRSGGETGQFGATHLERLQQTASKHASPSPSSSSSTTASAAAAAAPTSSARLFGQ